MIGTPFQQEVLKRLSDLSLVCIVGGAVRDKYLGIPSKDVDAVAALSLEELKETLSDWGYTPRVIGAHQPTVSLFQDKDRVDISVFNGDVETDALRRDFTLNAIYLDVKTREIKDPLNGLKALNEKRLEACGRAEERFKEDALRILRLIRLAVRYDFNIESETWQAACNNLPLIQGVSVERVTEELSKILILEEIDKALRMLDDLGYYKMYVPELARLKGLVQNRYHTKDAWEHTRHVVKNTPSRILLRLAALLHDIGKWETASRECYAWGVVKSTTQGYTVNDYKIIGRDLHKWIGNEVELQGGRLDNYPDTIVVKRLKPMKTPLNKKFEMVPDGKRHFLQHEKESARLVKNFLSRFRWAIVLPGGSKGERELHFLVGHHMLGTLTFMNELKGEIQNNLQLKARRFAWQVGWDGQNFIPRRVENLLDLWKADFLGGKQDAENNLSRLDRIQGEIRKACSFLNERAGLVNWRFFEKFACEKGLKSEKFGQFKEQVRKKVMLDSKYTLTNLEFLEKEYKFFISQDIQLSSERNRGQDDK